MPFALHRQLQEHYAGPTGVCEARVAGFVVDALRDGVVYEIQTQRLRSIRAKVAALIDEWPVVVVHPVAETTTFVYREGDPPTEVKRRTYSGRGTPLDIFVEAVSLAKLLAHPNLSIEIPILSVEELRARRSELPERPRRRRKWHRKLSTWVTVDRRIVAISRVIRLDTPADGIALLPERLANPFTTTMLAAAMGAPLRQAQAAAYTLAHAGALVKTRRTKEGFWYARCTMAEDT